MTLAFILFIVFVSFFISVLPMLCFSLALIFNIANLINLKNKRTAQNFFVWNCAILAYCFLEGYLYIIGEFIQQKNYILFSAVLSLSGILLYLLKQKGSFKNSQKIS